MWCGVALSRLLSIRPRVSRGVLVAVTALATFRCRQLSVSCGGVHYLCCLSCCRVVVLLFAFCPCGRRVVVTSLAVTVTDVLRSAGMLLVICSEVLRDICCRQLRLLCVLSSGLLVVANGAVQACAVEGLCIASRVRLPAAVARQCACCNWFWSSL